MAKVAAVDRLEDHLVKVEKSVKEATTQRKVDMASVKERKAFLAVAQAIVGRNKAVTKFDSGKGQGSGFWAHTVVPNELTIASVMPFIPLEQSAAVLLPAALAPSTPSTIDLGPLGWDVITHLLLPIPLPPWMESAIAAFSTIPLDNASSTTHSHLNDLTPLVNLQNTYLPMIIKGMASPQLACLSAQETSLSIQPSPPASEITSGESVQTQSCLSKWNVMGFNSRLATRGMTFHPLHEPQTAVPSITPRASPAATQVLINQVSSTPNSLLHWNHEAGLAQFSTEM
ncbi:hypothetical protein FRB94_004117 [Tulasnella sp. JGI-2019a]|nr:hypothetical protein FRB94_004117 [Tulasnella sp. JGI-2019a]